MIGGTVLAGCESASHGVGMLSQRKLETRIEGDGAKLALLRGPQLVAPTQDGVAAFGRVAAVLSRASNLR